MRSSSRRLHTRSVWWVCWAVGDLFQGGGWCTSQVTCRLPCLACGVHGRCCASCLPVSIQHECSCEISTEWLHLAAHAEPRRGHNRPANHQLKMQPFGVFIHSQTSAVFSPPHHHFAAAHQGWPGVGQDARGDRARGVAAAAAAHITSQYPRHHLHKQGSQRAQGVERALVALECLQPMPGCFLCIPHSIHI